MERAFKRDIAQLESVFGFISLFADRHGLSDDAVFAINLAVEELFVNMVRYNPGNSARILIDLRMDGDKAVVTLKDPGSAPFDPTKVRAYDVTRPIEERIPGGLGIHLVKSVMDDIAYEYRKGESIVTLTKHVGKAYV